MNSPTPLLVETKAHYRCDVKDLIKTDVLEMVKLNDSGLYMLTDEEGFFKKLRHNFFLQFLSPTHPIQTIVGDVIFTRFKPIDYGKESPYDYEIESITEEDIQFINSFLNRKVQEQWKRAFEARHGSQDDPKNYWRYTITPMPDN